MYESARSALLSKFGPSLGSAENMQYHKQWRDIPNLIASFGANFLTLSLRPRQQNHKLISVFLISKVWIIKVKSIGLANV